MFGAGFLPRTPLGSLQRSPGALVVLKGPLRDGDEWAG